ncbi:MAG: peptidoglycan-binding protein [Rivularia sp. ALOHA_DT_140]|nr:peptidoglycan-binding protein [Rivularia sp. ALOHA_DT_140]
MTVLGLLVASFITQGQPFLPTFSILVNFPAEKVQQRLSTSQRSSTFVIRIANQSKLSSSSIKYQKILFKLPSEISLLGNGDSTHNQSKSNFSLVLKDYSINAEPSLKKSFSFTPRKEWDMPQTPKYEAQERLLAQYYRGQRLPVLRYGNSGNAVRVLQTLLRYNHRYRVYINGEFDVLTETAVKAFQANRRLLADGIVGSRTWRALTRNARFYSQRDPMEIPMFDNQPIYPWQRSFRGKSAESTVSI